MMITLLHLKLGMRDTTPSQSITKIYRLLLKLYKVIPSVTENVTLKHI